MWLVTGASGQLGQSLCDALSTMNKPYISTSRAKLDITDPYQVHKFISEHNFATVVNCAAWTAVDDAEDNIADAMRINYEGPKNLALAARSSQTRLIHISSDYVFSGDASEPYEIDTPTNPLSAYGHSKQMGDSAVLTIGDGRFPVIRTAWLYSKYGRNFAKTMAGHALQRIPVKVVNDQIGQPTLASDLVKLILEVASHPNPAPIVHGTNAGQASWYDFAVTIYKTLGVNLELVTPVSSEAFPTKAPRPKYSVLGHSAFENNGLTELRDWKDALLSEIENIRNEVNQELQ